AAARDAAGVAAYGPVNAFHPLARLLWVKTHEPAAFARARYVLHPKDLIGFRLTGHTAGDALSWSGVLSAATGKLAQGWLDALALPGDLVPPIQPPQAILGPVQAALAPPFDRLANRPVIVGAMDTWCATLGAGAIAPERAYNVSGTSEVSGFLTRTPRAVPGLITLPWSDGLMQIGGPSQSGGDCLAWFARAFAKDAADRVDTLLADLARTPRQPEAILFLPYLSGERAPIWEPDARAVFFGLTARHGRVDLLWSVLEGIAFAVRDVLDRATDGDLARIDEIRVAGGGARHDPWCQIKADVLGRPLRRAASPEPGLVGAAALAFVAIGDFADLAAAQATMTGVERSFDPDAERHRHYSALFERFRALQAVAVPQARALVAALRRD
ncbi:MAG: carbohydrate kinase, partial [Proteobacteria bacterium]|nr:carbohydrate kinase [Pseudomonadota bacterium]